MRVLGLMVLLALTGCQSPPPLDIAQAQCQTPCYCANKHELVGAYGTQRYGGQLPTEAACYRLGRELDLLKADHDASARE